MRTARASLGALVLSLGLTLGTEGGPLLVPPPAAIDILPAPPIPPRGRIPQPACVGDIQRLARDNTPLAGLLNTGTQKETAHPWLDWKGTQRARIRLLEQARDLAAEELRNQNVATALELYWKLAVNNERCRLLALGKAELHAQLGRLDEAIARELKAPRERDDLALKISKLNTDELALRAGLETLNDQLALLVGWKHPEGPAYHPTSPLRVVPEAIDPEQMVAIGLHVRADLKLLRLLEAELDTRTLPVVQRWMSSINPLLGPMQLKTVLELILRIITIVPGERDPEVVDVRRQIEHLRQLRERQARSDILRQVELVQIKHQEAVQAQHRLEIQRIRLEAIQEKLDRKLVGEGEMGPVRLEFWQAEEQRIQAAIDWELARVELRKLQGLLTTQPVDQSCGPPPAIPLVSPFLADPFPRAFAEPLPGAVIQPTATPLRRETLPPPLPAGQFPPAFGSPSPSSGTSRTVTDGVPRGA